MDYTSIKVGQLPTDEISGGNFIPHEVAGILKKATFTDLAAFIGASDAVGFKAVSVQNGDTLPATSTQEFILVGPGTYNNVGGGSTITVTEELNALVSNGTYWFVGVEIPIDAPPGNAVWGQIIGTLSNQTDLQNLFNLKADLVDGKVPSSQLPSYVDDVIEVANYAALPATGETGKIYITIDTEYIYRWSGSAYIRIVDEAAAWGTITGTLSNQTDLQAALDAKEDDIAAGTTAQYWRGDKSWQTLNKAAVGLGSVDNTSDLNKPISTATQTALDGKFDDPTGDTTQYIAGDGSLISFPIAGQAGTLVREVLNNSGATITKGTVVYINGASGNKPTIAKALATGDSTSAQTFGLVQADISNNANGYVVCVGDLIGINTSGISVGTQLYLSSSVAGEYTTTKQYAPNHLVYVGVVTRSHATLGQIEVKIQNGYELDEIHDVAITSKVNNEVIVYESSTSLWKNKTIPTILGYTPQSQLSGTGFVKISGTTISYDNNTYVDTVTSQTIIGLKTFSNMPILSAASGVNGQIVYADASNQLKTIGNFKYNDSTGVLTTQLGDLGSNAYTSDSYALDSAVVHLTGNETISGVKTLQNTLNLTAGVNIDDAYGFYWKTNVGEIETALAGIGQSSSGLNFFTGSSFVSPRMFINSSGNVGIGTTIPVNNFHIQNGSSANTIAMIQSWGTEAAGEYAGIRFKSATTGNNEYGKGFLAFRNNGTGYGRGDLYFCLNNLTDTSNASLTDSKMVINSVGNILINLTSIGPYLDGKISAYGNSTIPAACFKNDSSSQFTTSFWNGANSGGTVILQQFVYGSGQTLVGNVTSNGSSTSYNTTSDYRLKQDLKKINGLDLISKIKVYDYEWKIDKSRAFGVLAHELQEIIPQAVNGEKDAEQMQGVDYSKLVPILIASIKELKEEIQILKN